MIRDILFQISSKYLDEKKNFPAPSNDSKFAKWIKNDVPKILSSGIPGYKISASSGIGEWPDVLWVAFLNTEITQSPRRGFYVTYLFSSDMQEVYLTISMGVSSQGGLKKLKKEKLFLIDSFVPPVGFQMPLKKIDLKANTGLSKMYEHSILCFKKYDTKNLPIEQTLLSDLSVLLKAYDHKVNGFLQNHEMLNSIMPNKNNSYLEGPEDEKDGRNRGNKKKGAFVVRYVRDTALSKRIKRQEKHTCQLCGVTVVLGENELYCEAHHIIQMGNKGDDTQENIIIVCPNCHIKLDRFAQKIIVEQVIKNSPNHNISEELVNKYNELVDAGGTNAK